VSSPASARPSSPKPICKPWSRTWQSLLCVKESGTEGLSLGVLERFATNGMIADRLREAGFSDISVTGSGATRLAEALWPGADTSAELATQLTEVVEL
jgi:hypothetical protein